MKTVPLDAQIRESFDAVFFVSPHLDDAVFSAGSLLLSLHSALPIEVITLFTEAHTPLTLSARQFLRQSGYRDVEKLFADRRHEDAQIFASLNIPFVHAGFEDALFRTHTKPSVFTRLLGNIIPEFMHVYPTYRWHVAKGNIARADTQLRKDITAFVRKRLQRAQQPLVVCPLGTGGHIDHVIVRDACLELGVPVLFWNDQPYAEYAQLPSGFIAQHELTPTPFPYHEKKKMLAEKYASQFSAVYAQGFRPADEVFYNAKALHRS